MYYLTVSSGLGSHLPRVSQAAVKVSTGLCSVDLEFLLQTHSCCCHSSVPCHHRTEALSSYRTCLFIDNTGQSQHVSISAALSLSLLDLF